MSKTDNVIATLQAAVAVNVQFNEIVSHFVENCSVYHMTFYRLDYLVLKSTYEFLSDVTKRPYHFAFSKSSCVCEIEPNPKRLWICAKKIFLYRNWVLIICLF